MRKEYGVKEIGILGSYVRGEQKEISDVDILIELEKPVVFFRRCSMYEDRLLQDYLNDSLESIVDIMSTPCLI